MELYYFRDPIRCEIDIKFQHPMNLSKIIERKCTKDVDATPDAISHFSDIKGAYLAKDRVEWNGL